MISESQFQTLSAELLEQRRLLLFKIEMCSDTYERSKKHAIMHKELADGHRDRLLEVDLEIEQLLNLKGNASDG